MKYFCISFHRTGTRSLNEALVSAGIPSLHYPHRLGGVNFQGLVTAAWNKPDIVLDHMKPVISAYDGHTDVPWPGLWREISAQIPEARFVLMLREPEIWWKSLSTHWRLSYVKRKLSAFERIQYADYVPDCSRRAFGIEHKDLFIDAYNAHIDRVRNAIPAGRLLALELLDPDKATKLGDFLQAKTVPVFSHWNASHKTKPVRRIYRKVVERIHNEFLPK